MAWQQHKIPIVLGSVSIILIASSIVLLIKTTQTTAPIQFIQHHSDGAGFIDAPAGLVIGPGSLERISVNNASGEDLEALPGIGPVTAKKIIDNRPYGSLEELLSKKVLSRSLYEKLKDQLSL